MLAIAFVVLAASAAIASPVRRDHDSNLPECAIMIEGDVITLTEANAEQYRPQLNMEDEYTRTLFESCCKQATGNSNRVRPNNHEQAFVPQANNGEVKQQTPVEQSDIKNGEATAAETTPQQGTPDNNRKATLSEEESPVANILASNDTPKAQRVAAPKLKASEHAEGEEPASNDKLEADPKLKASEQAKENEPAANVLAPKVTESNDPQRKASDPNQLVSKVEGLEGNNRPNERVTGSQSPSSDRIEAQGTPANDERLDTTNSAARLSAPATGSSNNAAPLSDLRLSLTHDDLLKPVENKAANGQRVKQASNEGGVLGGDKLCKCL